MGERKKAALAVLVSLVLFGSLSSIVFASSGNWVEVIRFEGNGSTQTDLFTCNYPEWRIRTEVVPSAHVYILGHLFEFSVTTHPQGEEADYVHRIAVDNDGWTDFTNGTSVWSNSHENSVVHENVGKFYMKIKAELVDRYTIVVEQNIDAVPEFPSWTILPLLLAITLTAVIYRKLTQQSY